LESNKLTKRGTGDAEGGYEVPFVASKGLWVRGLDDGTVRLFNFTGKCVATFEGHRDVVRGVAVSPDSLLIASGSEDRTIKLWTMENGACIATLDGEHPFTAVAFTEDGKSLLVGSKDGSILVYSVASGGSAGVIKPELRYTNAKVVLLGDSGVGKSGLAYRLTEDRWVITESTHGMGVWRLDFSSLKQQEEVDKEVWLWDLAGQPEYRLVHQLFLEETSLALMLFNPQSDDPFSGLCEWQRSLRMAVGYDPPTILIAARVDRGGVTLPDDRIRDFCRQNSFVDYFATSAKTNEGCSELRFGIEKHIPWERLPWTATTSLFSSLKAAIIRLKDDHVILMRLGELYQRLKSELPNDTFTIDDCRAAVVLLAGEGMIKRVDFGDFVLLQPEQINNYAAAVIRVARKHNDGIGCINEQSVLGGEFDFEGMIRLGKADEEILLRAMVQTFLDQSLCIREDTPAGVQLVFPSQFNRPIEFTSEPIIFISYRVSGNVQFLYSTLIVRLTYSEIFEKTELWKSAAEFLTPEGRKVGLLMEKLNEGVADIKIFFDDEVPTDTRVTFIKYVHEHLFKYATNVVREREYFCPGCGEKVENKKAISKRLADRKAHITCEYCDTRISLNDLIEQKFKENVFSRKVQELDEKAKINIDNESRELILVGQAYAIAGEAGQIYRGYTNSDHGIDGEIEFKDDLSRATGIKIYLQLKSGDSYLYKRQRDGKEIFTVRNSRHRDYWLSQAYPVFLVIRHI